MPPVEAEVKVRRNPAHRIRRQVCMECLRRKQRCNREWPCNHCQKRRVADQCHYVTDQPSPSSSDSRIPLRKRGLGPENELDGDEDPVEDVTDDETAFKALGYMPSSIVFNLSKPIELKSDSLTSYVVDQAYVIRAMEKLPPLHHLETLVSSFASTINYYYYIFYPPRLMEVYSIWREDVRLDMPLDPVVSCLVFRVCACAAQCLRPDVQEKIETDLNMPVQRLAGLCNQAAIELSGKIPAGKGGLLQVQQLLLTSSWHKSDAHSVDCWHALGAAIREAQEIGLNREPKTNEVNEFDREMRRRVWCILDSWDWQMSTLFSRPLLIDRRDCDVISPNVGLEGNPSPVYQMKLQHEIIQMMYQKFGNMDKPMSPADVREFRDMIEKWTESFPPMFRITDPDISMDEENTWIPLHRQYLHIITYSMILGPLKSYLCRTFDQTEPQEGQNLRASGVNYSLKLHDAHTLLFHSIYPIGAKYHIAQFSLSDLAMVLCSAVIHDEHRNLPKRDEVIGVIADLLEMLRQIRNFTGTALTSYGVLSKLIRRLPVSQDEIPIIRHRLIKAKFDYTADSTDSYLSTTRVSIDTTMDPQSICLLQIATKPVLDIFLERFLDFYGPEMPSASVPLYWIHAGRPYQIWRVGAAARTSSHLLCDTFTAVSTTHFGLSVGDWRLVSAGDRIYSSILSSLQTAICHPNQSKSEEVLMTVALCGVYESMRRTGERALITHALGALQLLKFRGAQRHTFGIAHWLFVELRPYVVFAAITTRTPTFLALPEWKSIPWSTGSTSKDLLQHLLDHMVDIPTLLAYADQIKSYSRVKSPAEILRLQQELWTLATNIEQGLYQWKREWADRYPNGQARELRVHGGDSFPTFRCRDPTTGAFVPATILVYPDPVLAQAMCHYFAALILVVSADTRPKDPELKHNIYDLACLICRAMGYYVRIVPSSLASRVAFPFRVAYDSLPKEGIERRYVEEVFRLIGKRRFSQEWECTLKGISVRR